MHEEASAPTDDAEQVGPDIHRSGQGSAVISRGTERKTAAHAELRVRDMDCVSQRSHESDSWRDGQHLDCLHHHL